MNTEIPTPPPPPPPTWSDVPAQFRTYLALAAARQTWAAVAEES